MIVVDVLLACNLVLFVLCAIRTPRPSSRPGADDLVVTARRPAQHLAVHVVPATTRSNVVPFRSRAELQLEHAKAMHPSNGTRH